MIACVPGETALVWLKQHESIPIDTRPVFEFPALSLGKKREFANRFDTLRVADDTPDQHYQRRMEFFCSVVTGWRNMPVPFSREAVWDNLPDEGVDEMLVAILLGRVSPDAKKNCE